MYDSVKIWQPSDEIKDSRYLERVPTLLTDVSLHKRENGLEYLTGRFDNLQVSLSSQGISLKGSLNKFWHQNNFNKLNRQETKLSFDKLSDSFGFDFNLAKVLKLDLAHNFIVNESVESYFHLLGESQYYDRLTMPHSLYYDNSQRTKLFYDKKEEGKSQKLEIPIIWENKNVIRFEFRLKSRLAKQLNMSIVLVSDLYEEKFYINLIDKWIYEYICIKKNKLLSPKIENMTNRNAKDYLLSALIEIIGHNEVNNLANQWKDKFSTSKEAQRFKKSLNDLKGLTEPSPLIDELDRKILRVKEFYR